LWTTRYLNEFSNLQSFNFIVIVEVEDNFSESVFEKLFEIELNNVYLNPTKKEINSYITRNKISYIVRKLITKAPIVTFNDVKYPTLEKIIVDLICDKNIFMSYTSSELVSICKNILRKYTINKSRLNNYSRRRGKLKEVEEFIKSLNGYQ